MLALSQHFAYNRAPCEFITVGLEEAPQIYGVGDYVRGY